MRASELAARAAGAASRLAGRGGTSLPGKLLLRMEPDAIERLSRPLTSAILSATNGKTTTAAMTARILERGGHALVHNRAGANRAGGVATALLRGAEVRISADRSFTVYADGDPIGQLPCTVRAIPGAVKVLLPA